MVSLRFTSFVFALVFILLGSAVYTHQAMEKILVAAGTGLGMARRSPLTTQMDIFYAVPAPAEGKSGKIGGRKMKRMILEKVEGKIEGETSKISGMDIGSRTKPNDSFNPTSRAEKEKKLVEGDVTDEMVNLMSKDYQGAGKRRNKPPINNYEPLGRGNLSP